MRYKKFFTMSYDDGVVQDLKLMKILDDYGLKATFNINSGLLGKEEYLEIDGKKIEHCVIPENNLCANYSRHEIAAHGATHAHLETLSHGDIVREITQDRIKLATIVGYEINGFAYPYGYPLDPSDKSMADIVRKECNLAYARTTTCTGTFAMPKDRFLWNPTCHHSNPELPELIDKFLSTEPTNGDMLLYIWGHSYEFDIGSETNSWDWIKSICEKVSGKRGITYCNNLTVANRVAII